VRPDSGLALGLEGNTFAADFDLVTLNGCVMDPETKLDAIRNVGINGGRIDVVTDAEISGTAL
jgi:N-acyl-D-amino-acid deacylase